MASEGSVSGDDLAFLPERVARKTFTVSFRGYDQLEVRAYIGELAGELRSLREREERLRHELDDARAVAARATELDEHQLTVVLGEETARVLEAAREAANQIKAKAEENLARMLREGQEEVARHRAELELALARKAEELEEGVAVIRAEAEEQRRQGVEAAAEEMEIARQRGREMVAEAQLVRERVLKDLARRRRLARQQIEQLRVGRERLLKAYEVVRHTLDQATDELAVAMPEARLAAELAARRVTEEDEASLEELEAEVAAARGEGEPSAAAPPSDAPSTAPEVGESAAPAVEEHPSDQPPEDTPRHTGRTASEPVERVEAEPAPPEHVDREPVVDPGEQAKQPDASGDDDVVEERRSSTLRLFRRRGAESRRHPDGPAPTLPERLPPDPRPVQAVDYDAVRILPLAQETVPDEATQAAEPVIEAALAAVDETDDVGEAGKADEGGDSALDREQTGAEVEHGGQAADPDVATTSVDELFARMRAEREAAAAHAQEVLAADGPEATGAGPADSQPEADESPQAAPSSNGAAVLVQREEAMAATQQAVVRRVKRALADEQNEVLDAIRRHRGKPRVGDVLPAADEHAGRYRTTASDGFADAWRAGRAVAGGASSEGDAAPADVLQEFGSELVDPLRDRLDRALEEAAGDDDELVERVRACYREWRTDRAERVTTHHALAAYSAGAYDAVPSGTPLCWIVDNGGVACPDADDNALAGAVEKGQPFPTGHLRPPAHPGCRCLAVPDHH